MKIANTTGDLARYNISKFEKVRILHDAGFRYIDLSLYQEKYPDSFSLAENWKDNIKRLQDYAHSLGMEFVQAHSVGGNPLNKDGSYEMLLKSTIRSIEVCGMLGIKNTVVHSGVMSGIGKEEYFERNLEFYKLLFPYMEKHNVNVLIENGTKANQRDDYFFFTGKDMKEFIDYAGHPLLKACWDTGHANIEGHQYEDIMTLGKDLHAIHFNDNRGKGDEHIMPFLGTMSMDEVMHGLIDSDFDGYFTLECDSSLRPFKYWQGDRRDYKLDNRLQNPPLCLAEAMESVLYKTAKYILEQYGLFEE